MLNDAEGIAKVHVDSWKSTYKEIIPSEYLNNLSYDKRTKLWEMNIGEKENFVIVAVDTDGEVIGFADAWNRDRNTEGNTIDLTSIYLLESYQGKGIGKKLLKELFSYFKEAGYEKVFVDVLEDNRTKLFYEYYGANLIETVQIKIGNEVLNELIYEWNDIDEVLGKLNRMK